MFNKTLILFVLVLVAGCASTPAETTNETSTPDGTATTSEAGVIDSELLPTHGAPQIGKSEALVTLSVFVDPAASDFPEQVELIETLVEERGDDMRVVLHPSADISASGLQAWRLLHFAHDNEELEEGLEFLVDWHEVWRGGDPIALAVSMEQWEPDLLRDYLATDRFRESLEANVEFSQGSGLEAGKMFVNGIMVTSPTDFRSQFVSSLAAAQALVADGVPRNEVFAQAVQANIASSPQLNIVDSEVVPIGDSHFHGAPGAPITIVGFMDLQCPFTARSWNTVKDVLAANPNQIRFVFKHLPLAFHRQAEDAAIAAEAARRQGKFLPFVDAVFANQKAMRKDIDGYVTGIASDLGLNMTRFQKDREDPEIASLIKADMELSKDLGIRGTPNFFANGEKIVGAQPLRKFEEVIDRQDKIARDLLADGSTTRSLYADAVEKNFEEPAPSAASKPKDPKPELVRILPRDASKGPATAPVTVVIFSDFQCPFCQRAVPTVEKIEQKYGKKVRLVFKHLPLPFHREAKPMAYAALAAGEQGKFWEMHDLLFENQKTFKGNADAEAERLAKKLGLNMKKFKADYSSKTIADQVEADLVEAKRVGARGTPNFFINGVKVVGAKPFPSFEDEIDRQLAIAERLLKSGVKPAQIYEKAVEANRVAHEARQGGGVDADVRF